MRIAYKNIIDESTTTLTESSEDISFPVENVKDERLSYKWIATGITNESVIVTLPTFPEIPDNASGTTWKCESFTTANIASAPTATQYAWANLTPWDSSGLSIYNGFITFTKTVAVGGILRIGLDARSKHRRCKVLVNGVVDRPLRFNNDATDYSCTVESGIWSICDVLFSASGVSTFTDIEDFPVGTHFLIWDYIGDGNYDTKIPDVSGNGLDLTLRGAYPYGETTVKSLFFNPNRGGVIGGGDYAVKVLNENTRVIGMGAYIEGGSANSGIISTYFNNGGTSGSGFNVNPLTNTTIRVSAGKVTGSYENIDTTIPVGLSGHYVYAEFNVTTQTCSFTIDGNQNYVYTSSAFSGTINFNAVSIVLGRAIIDSDSFYFPGKINRARAYVRTLSITEKYNLANNIHFTAEEIGRVGAWDIDYELGVNTAAVLGHNIKTSDTIKIQGCALPNNWDDSDMDDTILGCTNVALKFFTNTYYYKYWRFYFSEGAVEIGRLWLGKYITVDPSSLLNFKVSKINSDIVVHGKGRQKYSVPGSQWRKFTFNFPRSDENMIYLIDQLYEEVGNNKSFIFCNFDSIREYALVEPCYVSFNGNMNYNHIEKMEWEYSIEMEEEK
jgi:hypothetical protein